MAVKRLLKQIEADFGDQVEVVYHTGSRSLRDGQRPSHLVNP